MIDKIKEFFKNLKVDKVKVGLGFIILFSGLIIVLLVNKNSNLVVERDIAYQNVKALQDSVRISKNKVGDLEYSKNVLISTNGNLESLNTELSSELKKQSGKVYELTKIVATIKNQVDTVEINNDLIIYPNGVNGLSWDYEKIYDAQNYRRVSGVSKFSIDSTGVINPLSTIITNDEFKFNLVQGLREKDGNIEMFVRSDYPGFAVDELNSVIIDPQDNPVLKQFTRAKRWGLSGMLGAGATKVGNNIYFGPQVGVGLTYDFIQF